MDHLGNAGSVAYLKEIKHPISVARKIMEKSSHVMLVGEGAQKFALENGFKKENILYNQSKKDWLEWKKNKNVAENLMSEDIMIQLHCLLKIKTVILLQLVLLVV